jgi:hypothetical protein
LNYFLHQAESRKIIADIEANFIAHGPCRGESASDEKSIVRFGTALTQAGDVHTMTNLDGHSRFGSARRGRGPRSGRRWGR